MQELKDNEVALLREFLTWFGSHDAEECGPDWTMGFMTNDDVIIEYMKSR